MYATCIYIYIFIYIYKYIYIYYSHNKNNYWCVALLFLFSLLFSKCQNIFLNMFIYIEFDTGSHASTQNLFAKTHPNTNIFKHSPSSKNDSKIRHTYFYNCYCFGSLVGTNFFLHLYAYVYFGILYVPLILLNKKTHEFVPMPRRELVMQGYHFSCSSYPKKTSASASGGPATVETAVPQLSATHEGSAVSP